jgi:hypothetical protein
MRTGTPVGINANGFPAAGKLAIPRMAFRYLIFAMLRLAAFKSNGENS